MEVIKTELKKNKQEKKNVQQNKILTELTLKNVVQPVWRIKTLSSIHKFSAENVFLWLQRDLSFEFE